MKQIDSLAEMQKIEIAILDYIVEMCKENGLRYFLAGGTLLGAVRHKGFIPWDNDIDISMPRPDYNRLIELLKNDSNYSLLNVNNESNYYYPFVKVVNPKTLVIEHYRVTKIKELGLFVDIFPIDGFGDDKEQACANQKNVQETGENIAYSKSSVRGYPWKIRINRMAWRFVFLFLDRTKAFNAMIKKYTKDFDSSKFIASTFGLRGSREVIEQSCFASSVDVEFEGKMYAAPIGYDKYLRQMYGDYMKLPPEKDRIMSHNADVFWRN